MNYEETSVLIDGAIEVDGVPKEQLFFSNPPEFFISSNKDSINLPKGTPVSCHSSGVGFVRAANTGLSTATYGILAEDAAIGFTSVIFIQGTLTLSDWTNIIGSSFLQPKANYFLGASGLLTNIAPTTTGQISQLIGRAVSPVALEVVIDSPILL